MSSDYQLHGLRLRGGSGHPAVRERLRRALR